PQFDQRKVNPLVPALNPVSIEKDVFFNAWVLNSAKLGLNGVAPSSPFNLIFTGVEQTAQNGTATITTVYPGTKARSLDLFSFNFGCAANTVEGAASIGFECTILLGGVSKRPASSQGHVFIQPPAAEARGAADQQADDQSGGVG
ncbi:MAG: hypothetical protein Q9224_007410, partial [Gallowayella concinna]